MINYIQSFIVNSLIVTDSLWFVLQIFLYWWCNFCHFVPAWVFSRWLIVFFVFFCIIMCPWFRVNTIRSLCSHFSRSYCPTVGMTAGTPCPAGSYCPNSGMVASLPCPIATFCPDPGMAATRPCPIGQYCPLSGTITPTDCPAGSFCPSPSSSATKCVAGNICPQTKMGSQTPCPAGAFIVQSGTDSSALEVWSVLCCRIILCNQWTSSCYWYVQCWNLLSGR